MGTGGEISVLEKRIDITEGAFHISTVVARAAFDLAQPLSNGSRITELAAQLGVELVAAMTGNIDSFQELAALASGLMVFSEAPLVWPLKLDWSPGVWTMLTVSRWFKVMQNLESMLWALLYRASASAVPVDSDYAPLLAGEGSSIAPHVLRVASLLALPVCDRRCYVGLTASYAALALLAARAGDAEGVARLVDQAQAMLLAAGFLKLSDCFQDAAWRPTVTALWGLLFSIVETPVIQGARGVDAVPITIDGLHAPDPMPKCPKAKALATLPASVALELYRVADIVGRLLSWVGAIWFASHGTLLGAVRHGGIVPHDCDVDLTVTTADIDKLRSGRFLNALRHNGYELAFRPVQDLYAVFRLGVPSVPSQWIPQGYMPTEPYLQIYVLDVGAQQQELLTYLTNKAIHVGFGLLPDDVLPTKVMPFGATTVNVPADPEAYLSKMYGADWATAVRLSSGRIRMSDDVLPLTETNVGMALPTGPLRLIEFPQE